MKKWETGLWASIHVSFQELPVQAFNIPVSVIINNPDSEEAGQN